jgi:hypothetical protein
MRVPREGICGPLYDVSAWISDPAREGHAFRPGVPAPNKHQISTRNLQMADGPSSSFLPLVGLCGVYGV